MQQSKRWLSSSCLCHHESMMQHAKGSFASSAALTGAEGRRRICKALLKQHVRLKTVYGQCMQQIERLLSSFCLCHHEPMMQDAEGSFASTAALTGAEGTHLQGPAEMARKAENSIRALHAAEGKIAVKLLPVSFRTNDARHRRQLCFRSSSDGR